MASVDASIEIHYTSKTQLSSPTTLEIRCRVQQGKYDFDLEGQLKTSSPWVFSPFSIENAQESLKTLDNLQALKDEWVKTADEKLTRTATVEDAEDPEAAETQVTESGTETAEGEGTPEIRETEDDAEAEPLADGEPAEEAGSPEETKENEPIG